MPSSLLRTAGRAAALLACALHGAAFAQAAVPAHAPVEGPSFVPMARALLVVLGLLGAAVWVLRRAGLAPRGADGRLRVVSQLALGPRERVVIVEAGERWLVLGVGGGSITRLGTLPRGESPPAAAAPASFGALLGRLRGSAQ